MKVGGRYNTPRSGSSYTPTALQTDPSLIPTATAGLFPELTVRLIVPSPETKVMGIPEREVQRPPVCQPSSTLPRTPPESHRRPRPTGISNTPFRCSV